MKFKDLFFSRVMLKSLFVIFIFLLLFISAITYKNTLQLTNSSKWVMHSYKVHLELKHLMLVIKDAEVGQRGFLLTHNINYLKPYLNSKKKARQSLHKLRKLLSDNINQEKNMDRLTTLTESRFAYLRYTMYQDSLGPGNKLNFKASMDTGRKYMDSIQLQSDKMMSMEKEYLLKRNESYQNKTTVTPLLILLITLFSLVIFIMAYLKINKDLVFLEDSNKQLLIANESNTHAEKIGEFCTWVWDLETKKLSYSENLYRLMGTDSFDSNLDNFLNFVHPEDRERIANDTKNVLNGEKESLAQFFRIIRKDGELRYFKSIAKTVTYSKGKKTIIGITSDVTDEHNKNFELENRNFELEQINTELESFNHVASHDLQEPLRKIQIFISRISAADMELISETGREYIAKIQQATSRMRTLIDDLLLFSRSNKTDKAFEKTDLNELLQNAKQELAEDIHDKNATVKSEKLPVLNVIPYQIQQLFINLISNSLKYAKPDIAPIISIDCEEILISKVSFLKTNPEKKYYKITLSDNGIGFDQQFAESIFALFKRLHSPSEFPGTGIGLAICKKIVENHMGAIKADGKLNIGATFTIYLPK